MSLKYQSPNCGEIDILMTELEPNYILSLLGDNSTLIEWGCGGSTVYFLDHLKPNQKLVTIEHNKQWFEKIKNTIKDHPNLNQHQFLLIEPQVSNNYYARPEEEMPAGLTRYICPDIDLIRSGDVFLVDGIGRGAVAAFLSRQVKPESTVIIHDYVGREIWYDWSVNCYDYSRVHSGMVLIEMTNSTSNINQ